MVDLVSGAYLPVVLISRPLGWDYIAIREKSNSETSHHFLVFFLLLYSTDYVHCDGATEQ